MSGPLKDDKKVIKEDFAKAPYLDMEGNERLIIEALLFKVPLMLSLHICTLEFPLTELHAYLFLR